MNEEEKDSVKILNNTELDINTIYSVDLHTYNYAVKTVLNLIKKQQEELETLKRDFEIVDHECSRLEKEDIKKDKLINILAEQLTTPLHSKEWVIDYYKREIEKC